MSYELLSLALALGLFAGMLGLLEAGRRIGTRQRARDPEGASAGLGAVDGAVFGLLGLLVAFSFSGAASRFDQRRALIVEETNAIGTAYLRVDLLPAEAQPELRALFRRYVDSRLEVYRRMPNVGAAKEALDASAVLQRDVWRETVAAARGAGQPATMLLLPALNDMFDVTTTRTMATQMHPPTIIFAMLFGLALVSAMLAGYGMAGSRLRSWLHVLGFAAALALAVYVILDVEFPRLGLIRVDAFDLALRELRETM